MKILEESESKIVFEDQSALFRIIGNIFIAAGIILLITIVFFIGGIFFILFGILMHFFGKIKNTITVDKNQDIFSVKKAKPFSKDQVETIPLSSIKKIHIEHEASENMIEAMEAETQKNFKIVSQRPLYFFMIERKNDSPVILNNVKNSNYYRYEKALKKIEPLLENR